MGCGQEQTVRLAESSMKSSPHTLTPTSAIQRHPER
jgi:hypothetical protein